MKTKLEPLPSDVTDQTSTRQFGYAPVRDGRLYYETAGVGEPLVLIHGNAGDCRHWDLQFEALAADFRVIRYDARGFGQSSLPVEGKRYADYEDLSALLDFLQVKSAHVLGWSMGSGIAVDFALGFPAKTKSLILEGPWVAGYSSPAAQKIFAGFGAVQATVGRGRSAAADAWMAAPFFRDTIVDPAAAERFRKIAGDYSFWHLAHRDPRYFLEPRALGRLAEIRVPTLAITAERDVPACLEVADLIANSVPGARKITMAGAGHLMHLEEPEEFNRIVREFLLGCADRH